MPRVGIPSGGQTPYPGESFPSRQELRESSLGELVDPSTLRSLGRNRGFTPYNMLNEEFQSAAIGYDPDVQPYTLNDANEEYDPVAPVVLTDVPTSSTDYGRPRTVAAGYDPNTQTMTVVFRDGTFYNYYEVSPGEWENFHASISKGAPWLNRKNSKQASDGLFIGKPRGVAAGADVSPQIRAELYRVARTHSRARGRGLKPPRKRRTL